MKYIIVHKRFVKQVRKLPPTLQRAFQKRRDAFLTNDSDPALKIHPLHGKYNGYKSFNVTPDIRVLYREIDADTVIFTHIGSHSELYS
jgi:addiction module RelE/StbE family toxin